MSLHTIMHVIPIPSASDEILLSIKPDGSAITPNYSPLLYFPSIWVLL
jgi:hypothetical protein